jgi:hypothetical protein
MPPIYLPPEAPVVPTHPIVIPPDAVAPGVPSHPIYLPPEIWPKPEYPSHPIVIPPDQPGEPPSTIWPPLPSHPIVLPPGQGGGGGQPPTPPMPETGPGYIVLWYNPKYGWKVVKIEGGEGGAGGGQPPSSSPKPDQTLPGDLPSGGATKKS